MPDEEIDVRVRLRETAKFHSDSRRAAGDVDQITESTKKGGKAADDSSRKWGKLSAQLNVLRRVVGLIKPAAVITAVGLAAQGLSVLAAGGVAAASALGPLAGILVAYPALASAGAQGLGVFKFATMGVSDAVGGLNKELDPTKLAALSPPAQRFARVLDSMKAPVKSLQQAAQRGLFPGLTSALKILRPGLGQFHDEMELTGRTIGGLAVRGARLVGSRGFMTDLSAQARDNARWLGQLGSAGIDLTSAFRHVVRAGSPLVSWMVRLVVQGAHLTRIWAANARGSGALTRFFGETRRVATLLGSTLINLAGGLINVGKAAYPLGLTLLRAIQGQAKAFKDWTQSISGRNQLALFFRRARGPIFETGRLIRDIGRDLLQLSQGNQVGPLIRQFRTQLLPVLFQLIDTTTKQFGPVLIPMLVETTKLFATLAGSSGPLVQFVKLLTGATRALNWMLDNIPGLKPALVTLLGAIAVIKALSWANAIRNVTGLTASFRRLGFAAGTAAAAEQAASTGGLGGGGLTPGAAAARSRARIPTRDLRASQGLRGGLSRAGSSLKGVAAGAAAAGSEIALPVILALEVKDIVEQTTGIHFGPQDLFSGRFAQDLGKKLFGVRIKTGPLGIPIGTVKVKAKAVVDPNFTKDLERQLRHRFRLAAARSASALAAGLRQGQRGGKLTLPFRRDIYNQLAALPPRFRRTASLAMVAFARQQEASGKLPKGTTRNLIQYIESQFGKLPGAAGPPARRAARQVNTALASIHKEAVRQIPGLGPLIKDNLSGPLDAARRAADEAKNALINLPTRTPPRHKQSGGPVGATGAYVVGEQGPEVAWLTRGMYISTAEQSKRAIAAPHTPVPAVGAEMPALELVAPIHVKVGNESIYRATVRQAARVRRRKSTSSED